MSVSGASCFVFPLFDLQGARRIALAAVDFHVSTSKRACQDFFQAFSNFPSVFLHVFVPAGEVSLTQLD